MDKIFVDCRSIALNYIYTVRQNFQGSKIHKIHKIHENFTLEIFRQYGTYLVIHFNIILIRQWYNQPNLRTYLIAKIYSMYV